MIKYLTTALLVSLSSLLTAEESVLSYRGDAFSLEGGEEREDEEIVIRCLERDLARVLRQAAVDPGEVPLVGPVDAEEGGEGDEGGECVKWAGGACDGGV